MKNIGIFCDGTWQHLDQPHPTNVANLARAAQTTGAQGQHQVVYYDDGVGVAEGVFDTATHLLGGALGKGLDYKIVRAYEFLALNYDDDDRVFIFGFSRGAYTARSLAGLIRWAGIVRREHANHAFEAMTLYRDRPSSPSDAAGRKAFEAKMQAFRHNYAHHPEPFVGPQAFLAEQPASLTPSGDCGWIQYVGVWDTVGALGIPSNLVFAPLLDRQYRFYDTSLSRSVRSARHAVSIDERRKTFSPTLWENIDELNDNAQAGGLGYRLRPYQQQWFPGVHGDVGGGSDDHGISLPAMLWIAEGAARAGFAFDEAQIRRYTAITDPCAAFAKPGLAVGDLIMGLDGMEDRRGPVSLEQISLSAKLRWAKVRDYRPAPLRRFPGVEAELNLWVPGPDPQAYYDPA